MLRTTVARIVEFEYARHNCTRRRGGLPFSVRLLSPVPRGVRNADAAAAPARDEGEAGQDAPTISQNTDKDEVGETTSDTGRKGCTHSIPESFKRKFGPSGP